MLSFQWSKLNLSYLYVPVCEPQKMCREEIYMLIQGSYNLHFSEQRYCGTCNKNRLPWNLADSEILRRGFGIVGGLL